MEAKRQRTAALQNLRRFVRFSHHACVLECGSPIPLYLRTPVTSPLPTSDRTCDFIRGFIRRLTSYPGIAAALCRFSCDICQFDNLKAVPLPERIEIHFLSRFRTESERVNREEEEANAESGDRVPGDSLFQGAESQQNGRTGKKAESEA